MTHSKLVFAFLLAMAAVTHGQSAMADEPGLCAVACKPGATTPRCMKLSKSDGRGEAFKQVYSKMLGDSERIEAAWLMEKFAVDEDPCKRADSVRKDNVWENSGSECRISSSVSIFNNKKMVFSIEVPRRVAFKRTISGGVLRLTPASPMAVITFADGDLNNDWGGGILGVNATASEVQFQLPKGCIQIPTM